MNEDMSDLFSKLNTMIKNDEIPDSVKDMLSNMSNQSGTDTSSDTNEKKETTNETETNKDNSSNGSFDISSLLSQFQNQSSNKNSESNTEQADSGGSDPFDFNIDLETIMRMKSMFDGMKTKKNDPRSNLLLSLKPYLREEKKGKVDEAIRFMGMSQMLQFMGPLGGDRKNAK